MKITKNQLRRIIREEKARLLNEQMPGVDRQVQDLWSSDDPDTAEPMGQRESMKAARNHLNSALTIFERMGYDEAADYIHSALEAMEFPEGTY